MSVLPKGFEALEKFAAEYALATPVERQKKRASLTIDELREFYAAVYPHMDRIFQHLKKVPIDALSREDKALYNLGATWFELSHPIDLGWRETDESGVFPYERVVLTDTSPGH
jgi:hypothetical protein